MRLVWPLAQRMRHHQDLQDSAGPSAHHLTPTIVSSRMECQTISRLYILTSVHPSKFRGLLRLPPSCCLVCTIELQLYDVHLCNMAVTIYAAVYLKLQSRSSILLP